MINVNGLKRNAKNIVKKYSDAQVKVREATSNDPWGPSSTTMAEIADLTYNVVAFSEIMQMIWKRLNDHGKNWRHVYKALVLLEYLIKTGIEKVAQQCIENIFAIQTLKDFQYMEDNKDHGMNIREKSKKLVALLKDSEKLKAERARALKAKSRLAEAMSSVGKSSLGSMITNSGNSGDATTTALNNNGNNYLNYHNDSGSSSSGTAHVPDSLSILGNDLDSVRPHSITEEDYQLRLALALSKEEAELAEKTRKNDELRLQLALDVSKKAASNNLLDETNVTSSTSLIDSQPSKQLAAPAPGPSKSTIDDLLGLTIPPPESTPAPQQKPLLQMPNQIQPPLVEPQNDPWSVDPWQTLSSNNSGMASSSQPANLISSTIPSMPMQSASLNPVPSIIPASNNGFFNKKPMSKNPFED